jgi:hypothetical protein
VQVGEKAMLCLGGQERRSRGHSGEEVGARDGGVDRQGVVQPGLWLSG